MIEVNTNNEKIKNELADVAKLFSAVCDDISVFHSGDDGVLWRDGFSANACGREIARSFEAPALKDPDPLEVIRQRKRFCKNALYSLLKEATNYQPPWGSLTGIRPTRLLYEYIERGFSPSQALSKLMDDFDLSGEKAALLGRIHEMQRGIYAAPDDAFDVYIGIPFCPTRCAYCSFVSFDMARGMNFAQPYVEALIAEMKACAADMRNLGKNVRALYIGGGTPTALPLPLFEKMLNAASDCFGRAGEFTVEAGRPDSIDADKLRAIKRSGADRISINPQTMNDKTLEKIGRRHSSADIVSAFDLSRSLGFGHINADIIAALPGETSADFALTLERLHPLSPESITVHTLAIKRSSRLKESSYAQSSHREAQEMVKSAALYADSNGYEPYYLYRQKYMAGNLENVGYCRPGFQCAYNIDIMEETTPILAFGAGAISKWLYDSGRRIERAANVKNVEEYIARTGEMIERKRRLYF
ncbi:MAG: coproporphyrinogen dehydrogenase HemZ [Christensenellales bacterium]|jgi:coproporphyrinogen dehydrogenase HemZ